MKASKIKKAIRKGNSGQAYEYAMKSYQRFLKNGIGSRISWNVLFGKYGEKMGVKKCQ